MKFKIVTSYLSVLWLSTSAMALTIEEQKDEHLLTIIHDHNQDSNKLTDGGKERIEALKKIPVEKLTPTQAKILHKVGAINQEIYNDFYILNSLKELHRMTNYVEPSMSFDNIDFQGHIIHLRSMNPSSLNSLQKLILDTINLIPIKTSLNENNLLKDINEAIEKKSYLGSEFKSTTVKGIYVHSYMKLLHCKTEGLTDIQQKIKKAMDEYEKTHKPMW